jgi:hypothetical protein
MRDAKPTPAMIRALREAKYHSDLVERDGKIYSRRSGTEPVCSKATVMALVARGWLRRFFSKYEITDAGKLAERDLEGLG